jgi:T-complex protein 1 subunit delta
MDKMVRFMTEHRLTFQIQTSTGEVVITNDGATILKHMAVLHPAARMVRLRVVID